MYVCAYVHKLIKGLACWGWLVRAQNNMTTHPFF